MRHVKNPATGKCNFLVTADGRVVKIQRKIFSECFYMMAMCELARATKDDKYKVWHVPLSYCSQLLVHGPEANI